MAPLCKVPSPLDISVSGPTGIASMGGPLNGRVYSCSAGQSKSFLYFHWLPSRSHLSSEAFKSEPDFIKLIHICHLTRGVLQLTDPDFLETCWTAR